MASPAAPDADREAALAAHLQRLWTGAAASTAERLAQLRAARAARASNTTSTSTPTPTPHALSAATHKASGAVIAAALDRGGDELVSSTSSTALDRVVPVSVSVREPEPERSTLVSQETLPAQLDFALRRRLDEAHARLRAEQRLRHRTASSTSAPPTATSNAEPLASTTQPSEVARRTEGTSRPATAAAAASSASRGTVSPPRPVDPVVEALRREEAVLAEARASLAREKLLREETRRRMARLPSPPATAAILRRPGPSTAGPTHAAASAALAQTWSTSRSWAAPLSRQPPRSASHTRLPPPPSPLVEPTGMHHLPNVWVLDNAPYGSASPSRTRSLPRAPEVSREQRTAAPSAARQPATRSPRYRREATRPSMGSSAVTVEEEEGEAAEAERQQEQEGEQEGEHEGERGKESEEEEELEEEESEEEEDELAAVASDEGASLVEGDTREPAEALARTPSDNPQVVMALPALPLPAASTVVLSSTAPHSAQTGATTAVPSRRAATPTSVASASGSRPAAAHAPRPPPRSAPHASPATVRSKRLRFFRQGHEAGQSSKHEAAVAVPPVVATSPVVTASTAVTDRQQQPQQPQSLSSAAALTFAAPTAPLQPETEASAAVEEQPGTRPQTAASSMADPYEEDDGTGPVSTSPQPVTTSTASGTTVSPQRAAATSGALAGENDNLL